MRSVLMLVLTVILLLGVMAGSAAAENGGMVPPIGTSSVETDTL
ncbi:MAG: hypothetical protein ACOY93_10485 [Bacillota bacterium]